jgi:hypothetical protein
MPKMPSANKQFNTCTPNIKPKNSLSSTGKIEGQSSSIKSSLQLPTAKSNSSE